MLSGSLQVVSRGGRHAVDEVDRQVWRRRLVPPRSTVTALPSCRRRCWSAGPV